MILHIFYIASLSHMKCMDAVMACLRASFSVDAATRDDRHVCPVFNVEIIVNDIHALFGHHDRNMHLLVLRLAADMDINARLIFFFHDIDMAAVAVAHCHSIQPQIICTLLFKPIGVDHLQHIPGDLIQIDLLIGLHRVHLLFVSCTHRNPVPVRTVLA